MIFAAIADVHGNAAALDAVLADIRRLGITEVVNLGDCLSGPLEAAKTADRLMALDIPTVRGNHDRYLVEVPPAAMGASDAHAYAQLSPHHVEWLAGLPFSLTYRDEVFLCHATPGQDDLYFLEEVCAEGHVRLRDAAGIEALAAGIAEPLILCAHSHVPRLVALADGRQVVNPGSVGCPAYQDDTPVQHRVGAGHCLASYAVLEKTAEGWAPQFRSVRYDNMSMARMAAANGRPDWANALSRGRV